MIVRLGLIVTLFAALLQGSAVQPAAAQPNVEFLIEAPSQVEVDMPIEITLRVQHAQDFAAYEAAMLFDTEVAMFSGQEQRDNDIKQLGRDVAPLAVVEQPYGAVIGLYSCPDQSCVFSRGRGRQEGGSGNLRLGRVLMVASEPGNLEIRFTGIKLVDAKGNPIGQTIEDKIITIRVGDERRAESHPAPAPLWSLPTEPGTPDDFDVTRDQSISYADAAEVALAWSASRERGQPCSEVWDPAIDVNQDGCVDVADVQLVAAQSGNPVRPPADSESDASAVEANAATAEADGPELAQAGATFTVNSTGDEDDNNIGDGVCQTQAGACTLRAAIREANTSAGPNTIAFNIPGGGVQRIQLTRALPALSDQSGGATIDGYTQPGASPNSAPLASNANLTIEIRGEGEDQFAGLAVTSSNNVIRGLSLFRLRKGIYIYGSGATDNVIAGNFIGTDAAGSYVSPLVLSDGHGVHIELGSARNRVGSTNLADRNVISGNGRHGIGIWHGQSDANVIQNNIVGLSPDGSAALPNRRHGIDINYGSSNNIIGGAGANARNVSSGNDDTGIEISHLLSTTGNQVIGNFIGTDLTGSQAPAYAGNKGRGIMLEDGANDTLIEGNVIVSSGRMAGVEIRHSYTSNNVIRNNRIGVTLNGSPGPNLGGGIDVNGNHNVIGPGNIIAFNQWAGINFGADDGEDSDFNTATRNSTYSNGSPGLAGLGINIYPAGINENDPGDADTGPNQGLNFPVIQNATPAQVSGTACANCVVEIFIADDAEGFHGEGQTFVASGAANGRGDFTIAISSVTAGQYLTATATDPNGNTSEFSLNVVVAGQ